MRQPARGVDGDTEGALLPKKPPAPHRILVVDDDADWRQFLTLSLHELGYQTVEAANGVEALDALSHDRRFAAILLDLNMPGLRGEEVAERLPDEHPKVVFLTAAAAEDVGTALRKGPHYYLPKGANQQQLSLLLQSLEA
jgi:CheY-like chemotaxis protein